MPQEILINGAGIAGIALSILLLRLDPTQRITIVERSPSLRAAGQQIDLRAQGLPVMRKLGLLDAVKARTVAEDGFAIVDARGAVKAVLGKNDSGKGQQALTSEYEIMRGDLVDVLYRESLEWGRRAEEMGKGGGVKYEFGRYATELIEGVGTGDGVDVVFSDGKRARYDLVVGADGQGSRTRRMAYGEDAGQNIFKDLGLSIAYFSIPKIEGDGLMAKLFQLPLYRNVTYRTGDRSVTQVYLGILDDSDELKRSTDKSVDEQKALWRKFYDDCAWQRERLLTGISDTQDFYATRVGQVKMDNWANGRVVLVGDAGYCPSSITGLGTTASLVGAYILAGELARNKNNTTAALESYDKVLRPFVDQCQKLPPGIPNILYPKTEWGIWFLQSFVGIITSLKIDKAINMLLPEGKGGWEVPDYPELNLEG